MSNNMAMTASETLSLWNAYLAETMTIHVTEYFIKTTDDKEIKDILNFALHISQEGVKRSAEIFADANHPLPQGFTEEDVNMNAPKAFSDNMVLLIKNKLIQDALVVSNMALGNSIRSDIRTLFERQIKNGSELVNKILDLIQKKGLLRPIHIPFPEQIEKVKSSFLFTGGLFEGNRPLSTAEIFNLELNFQHTAIISAFFKAFSQYELTGETKLKQHFLRGMEIFEKHLKILQSRLSESGLPQLPTWESEIIDTSISPFSDRLMLFKTTLMLSAISGRYGVAVSTVLRKDIGSDFMRLMAETLKFAEDTINMLIKKGYLDQHPLANEVK